MYQWLERYSMGTNACCFCKGREFVCQHSWWAAHNCLEVQGFKNTLLTSASMRTCARARAHTHTQIHNFKIQNIHFCPLPFFPWTKKYSLIKINLSFLYCENQRGYWYYGRIKTYVTTFKTLLGHVLYYQKVYELHLQRICHSLHN